MQKIYNLLILLFAVVAISSCATPFTSGYTVIAPKGKINKTGPLVEGEACSRNFLFGIVYLGNGGYHEAMNLAIENGTKKGYKGNSLVNVEVIETIVPLLIYNSSCVTVKGQLVSL